jgi:hypothetical protein
MDNRAYYQLYKGYRGPKTEDEYEYIIKKLYRQLKKAYTVDEAKAIVEEIYKYKSQMAERVLNKWQSSVSKTSKTPSKS